MSHFRLVGTCHFGAKKGPKKADELKMQNALKTWKN